MTPTPPEDNNDSHITVRELDARLQALHHRILLYIGGAVGLIRFDLPAEVTVGAITIVVLKASWAIFARS